jgi:hypothetical protein
MFDSLWNREWEEIKNIITAAAAESLWKRKKNYRNNGAMLLSQH